MSGIARVEVPAAVWRKQRIAELSVAEAAVLVQAFEVDLLGTPEEEPRFAAIDVRAAVLDGAASLLAAHGLRAYDAVQLASALAAREADPDCESFACFDHELRDAASASGFTLIPE
ncbi:MAG: type II toxin-antitoxin system VapC family toxin [Solirubrobacterales bacterium]